VAGRGGAIVRGGILQCTGSLGICICLHVSLGVVRTVALSLLYSRHHDGTSYSWEVVMKTTLPIEWLDRWGKPTWLFDACVVRVSSSIHVTSGLYKFIH